MFEHDQLQNIFKHSLITAITANTIILYYMSKQNVGSMWWYS